jgi:hypothetical protein
LSSAPRLQTAIDSTRNVFNSQARRFSASPKGAVVSCPSVLLVGRNGAWGSSVLQSLEKFGCELSLVPPETVTADYVRENEHAVILLDSTVSPEQRRMLTAELTGSRATIFYTFPVENGCWWLPALKYGENCHGSAAFRRKEFPQELERILSRQTEN